MLMIRDQQLEAFEHIRKEEFVNRLAEYLREHCQEACASRELQEVRAIAATETARACRYGLSKEREIVKFATLMLVLGSEGNPEVELPVVREFLTDPRVPEVSSRLNRLYMATLDRLEIEANNQRIMAARNHGK